MGLAGLVIAFIVLALAGFSKGITGMGIPFVATPVLTLLYGLPTAIAITMPVTVLTDIIMLIHSSKSWRVIKRGIILMLSGGLGIVSGTFILININPNILSGILGTILLLFVCSSYLSILPKFAKSPPKWVDGIFGVFCGNLQGAAGASGPIVSMYLFQMNISRKDFLFLINCFFVVLDVTQLSTITTLGFYEGNKLFPYSLLAIFPSLIGLWVAFKLNKKITDNIFKHSILILITINGVLLLFKFVFSFYE
ncbi:sulfite exporter TauE/SafE family protein [Bacillus canaveralius]|uniref:sulfite exporter TauE/SafE family protein n=1 Tax=Bacillus canaveralius TaxID=1403243 RepID=UPI000F77322D|nr:sulfite exporter TauE/SafE family protein [Bacillus canaveralius]RSK55133.1 sulfite exporter TauE/SafE family protein [Bacillus canaveralius]